MKKVLIGLLTAGLITSGCQNSTESVLTKEESKNIKQYEKKGMTSETNDISTSNLSGIAMYLKEPYRLEDLEKTLLPPKTKEETKWLYEDNFAKYTFESDGTIINHIKIELLEPKELKYADSFKLLGLDISLGAKIESEDYGAEGYTKYDVRGNDAESVLIERFSGTGSSSMSVSVDGAFKHKKGSVWLDCDQDGNVKSIEMTYEGKPVGNETEIANDNLDNPSTEEITVYSLIQNKIKIGDRSEELEKIASDQYKSEFDTYSYSLSGNLYGHISKNLIQTLTVRLDKEPISLEEADHIINSILPDDAVLLDSRKESPYIFYNYSSASLPSPSKIEVQVGTMGGIVKVIGFTSDIGTTVYYNN